MGEDGHVSFAGKKSRDRGVALFLSTDIHTQDRLDQSRSAEMNILPSMAKEKNTRGVAHLLINFQHLVRFLYIINTVPLLKYKAIPCDTITNVFGFLNRKSSLSYIQEHISL